MELSWEDIVWEDPDGGRIVLHGVLPTTVHPQSLRPRIEWHALALLEGPEIEDVWQLEEASEKESPGINLASALLGGGLDSALIEDLTQLDEIQTGRFPDPEPRRLHRLALRHERPVYCIEPTLDDEAWEEQRTQEAKVSTHWRKRFRWYVLERSGEKQSSYESLMRFHLQKMYQKIWRPHPFYRQHGGI